VRRYQVINRSGEPVLQVASANGRYTDQHIDEEALRELITGQDKNRAQREANRGKTGPRHTTKNRRTKAPKNSSGQSSKMATDKEENSLSGHTIPAGSSNAVPQGPQRRTTNLESASLREQAGTTEYRQPQPREAGRQVAPSRQRASPPPQPQQQPRPRHQPSPQPQPQP
jgi:hypothetical protein